MGAVLHTANPRLSDKQIAFTIAHAGSRILFFEPNLAELVARLRPLLPGIERYVLLAERGTIAPDVADTLNYEALLASEDGALTWMSFDEKAAAFLCYTSGTRSEEQTSELQSLMRNSYAVFCLKK